ncbi:MAG TPA: hypothetical protein VE631_01260 [Alphaproteobacteria bacterium]|nr:hypothetical protein [Alphaproteobacteria bacterium]
MARARRPAPPAVLRALLARHPHLRFLLAHLLGGLIGAVVFFVLIMWTDFAGLWSLVSRASEGPLVAALLLFGLFVTFGSVAMGVGVMSMRREDDSHHNDTDNDNGGR